MAVENIHRAAMSLIAGCTVVCTLARPVWGQSLSGKGTLGLLIITKGGMVLAADSRTTYGDGHHDEHAVKIFQLGRSAGCMIAGTVFVPTTPSRRGFDLLEEIRKVAAVPDMRDDPDSFRAALSQKLETAIFSAAKQAPPRDFFNDDNQVASLLIGGYALLKGEPALPDRYLEKAFKVGLLSRPEAVIDGGSEPASYSQPRSEGLRAYSVRDVQRGGPFAILTNGNDQLLKSILTHRRAIFLLAPNGTLREIALANLDHDEILNTYFELRERKELDSISLKEAVDLAEALIGTNIKLAGDDLGIGGTVEIATITREDGFHWVSGHDPGGHGAAGR